MEYTFTQLFWLFLIYSFIGWIIEAAVGTIKKRSFINRGFSTGPFCLVYGAGAILMTVTLTELLDNFFLLFVSCAIQATIVEWITGKTLERLNHHKWWDYSDKKWNFDGYICFQYTVLWGILGVICLKGGNPLFMTLYRQIPEPVTSILVWVLMGYVLLDALVSLAAALHLRTSSTEQSRLVLIRFAEHRMAKAYPVIQEKTEEILREGKFAEGCGFYKLFWLFLIGSLLGDITETIFCRLTAGEWMFRSSLVWGPFSVVWGFAIVLATALLYKDRDKPDRHIFLIGTFLGGAYEYTCSVLSELVFGQVFWDYSEIPFNLGGRVNLLYCFFWGIAAVVWIKGLYPHFAAWIEKIPKAAGYIATWILVAFMAANILVSAAALIRYGVRDGGPAATSGWERIIDTHFDDTKMKQLYPNSKMR
ncbi:putative ABC transporter permease [Lachnospiraceae bacterium DSM 108991]|uniref:ABC transporter permease n=1 Tax=Claveliimonas monacensis TaxID=2779351 RepID=A0ABR9RJP1_9FIRM|nr:putative ABC transporter permease [Claveliimonas monacensis]MBE5063164.1 putative ABC transporter permease [Claveliimonas monacensis]